jgi:signal transduction histidine kinase
MTTTNQPLRTAPQLKQPRNPISRKQIERVLSRSVAIGSLVFAAQTVPSFLAQYHEADPLWIEVIVASLVISLISGFVFSLIDRHVQMAHGIVAAVVVIALYTWPFAILVPHSPNDNHWLYYLLNVGSSTAAIAFSWRIATTYLFVVPSIYGIVRMTPAGGSEAVPHAILDSVYSIIFGSAVLIIITMLRATATSVDIAQGTALERYGHAVRQHATEMERVQVDSIVHDSVLTTLISAARAYTPEARKLAAEMAGNAIGHLHDAALTQPDEGTTVRLRAVAARISDAARSMVPPFEVRTNEVGTRAVPTSAGEVIYSAAVQAMINSIQHAGDSDEILRWIGIKSVRPGGIEVEIGDTGKGFRLEGVPRERLGVRVSIIELVTNSGGSVVVKSEPGHGTVVTIRWPARVTRQAPLLDEIGSDLLAGEPEDER